MSSAGCGSASAGSPRVSWAPDWFSPAWSASPSRADNALLYASDASSPFHGRAREFLDNSASGSEIVYLAWITAMAYLRVATHPAIFENPLSPDEAIRNLEGLLPRPRVRLLADDERFWDVYREVTDGLVVRGNLVTDAHLAALLRQHGVRRLYTNDTDFRKFRFLDVRNPFD